MAAYSHLTPTDLDDQQWRRVVALRVLDSSLGGLDFDRRDVDRLLASPEGRAAFQRHACRACDWTGRNDDGSTCRMCVGSRMQPTDRAEPVDFDPDGPDGPIIGLALR